LEPSGNIGIGEFSASNVTDGWWNVAIGTSALEAGTSADQNIAIGHSALRLNLSGWENIAIGSGSAYRASGNGNISLGSYSGYFNGGNYNVAIGQEAMGGSLFSTTTSSSQNVAIGKNAMRICEIGDNNVVIGADSGGVFNGSNNIVIGYNAQTSDGSVSNEITLGNSSINNLRIPGLGIDWNSNTSPGTSWTSYTPTWSSDSGAPSIGNGNIGGRYKQIGKTVFFNFKLTYGSTTTGGSGAWMFGLPVTAYDANYQFPASILNNGLAWYGAVANGNYKNSTSHFSVIHQNDTATTVWGGVTATAPFTFGTGDTLTVSGSYEAA